MTVALIGIRWKAINIFFFNKNRNHQYFVADFFIISRREFVYSAMQSESECCGRAIIEPSGNAPGQENDRSEDSLERSKRRLDHSHPFNHPDCDSFFMNVFHLVRLFRIIMSLILPETFLHKYGEIIEPNFT